MSDTRSDNDTPNFQVADPAICTVNGARLEVEDTAQCNAEGRPVFAWRVFSEEGTLLGEGEDLCGPVFGPEPSELSMLGTLLGFLEHAVESEDSDLFPEPVLEWARDQGSDLSTARLDLPYDMLSGVLDPDREGMLAILRQVRDNAGDVAPEPGDNCWTIDVRLQVSVNEDDWSDADAVSWAIHYGSSDYDQDHRGHWGSAIVGANDREEDLANTLESLLDQAYDCFCQSVEI